MDEGNKEESGSSLTDRYKLPADADADSKSWTCLLDLTSPVKVESDWYTTQTFQVFLDALDINQPTSLGRDTTIAPAAATTTISNTANGSNLVSQSNPVTNDKMSPAKDKTSKQTGQQRSSNFETILSAEALKILSELPDISHMSVTRSFMFPASTNNVSSRTTTAGKR